MDHNCEIFQPIASFELNCFFESFHTDPSGTFTKYEAKAIGSGSEAAQSELQDKYHKVRAATR